MENKINIAELLKDCPKGMELDCVSYDNVSFDKISDDKKATYPIFCYITDKEGNRSGISFTENGCESRRYGAKCVIFPRGKTTWEGFVPPCKFQNGDILYVDTNDDGDDDDDCFKYVFIFEKMVGNKVIAHCYTSTKRAGGFLSLSEVYLVDDTYPIRFATEEEKEKLFYVIKANGYKWNAETKTLEKLCEPIFKVGDRIKKKSDYISGIITQIDIENFYRVKYLDGSVSYINSKYQDNYELVPNKFDISTLKPFESRVLVRDASCYNWEPDIFGRYSDGYITLGGAKWNQCIPYEGNEHLLGTTDECDNYYKTWK